MTPLDIDEGPKVLVVADKYLVSGTVSPEAMALTPHDALTRLMTTDGHFAAYEPDDPPTRHRLETIGKRMMRLFVVDAEPADHKAAPEWRAAFAERATHLPCSMFGYWTRGGARLVARIDRELASTDEWSRWYLMQLVAIAALTGIVADPSCSDATRVYRLPHATRDGVLQQHGWICGHPAALPMWSPPTMSEGEILGTVGWLAAQSDAWRTRAKKIAPPPPPVAAPVTPIATGKGYANAALARACVAVRSAQPGQRHIVLAAETFSIGTLVGAGRLARDEAIRHFNAAVEGWPNQAKTRATIAHQIDAGAAHPRAS